MLALRCSALAALALATISSTEAMETFLTLIPNGSKFAKALGHTSDGYTAFGTAFLAADTTWSTDFCKQTFPGASMTNGEAFGDPCCTWTKSGDTVQDVTVFTTTPTKKTTCASTTTTAPAATTATPTTSAPSTTTTTPTTTKPSSTTTKPSSTTKKPSSTAKKPSSSTKKPSSSTKKPSSSTKKPSSSTKKPSSSTPASGTKCTKRQ